MSIIPYGVADYKTIVKDKSVYVDKTPYIEKLEQIGRFNIFLRPRRFGKSLMLNVLQYYYDLKSAGDFDYLFGHTYIGKHKTAEANSYHVLKFVFTSIDKNLFKEITSRGGFVRNFYEVFKDYSSGVISRLYITGVTPITLDSLTSGLNNATNISNEFAFNEMAGFNEEEVLGLLDTLNLLPACA